MGFEPAPTIKKNADRMELHCGNLHQPLGWVRCQVLTHRSFYILRNEYWKINLYFGEIIREILVDWDLNSKIYTKLYPIVTFFCDLEGDK